MELFNKHYITLDANNCIIKGFSNAFETPSTTDICINEKGGRQFELLGQINPPLLDMNGSHLYKYNDGIVTKTTEEERMAELEKSQLPALKANKIAESKRTLEEFLTKNPYLFKDGKYYSVTKDKQYLLANTISIYQRKTQSGEANPVIRWNAAGEQCTEWTLENIIELELSISAYVEPLVAKQQEFEVKINSCKTKAELDNVVIEYNTTK